jgi:polar amino acid transport system substrate-binding protein
LDVLHRIKIEPADPGICPRIRLPAEPLTPWSMDPRWSARQPAQGCERRAASAADPTCPLGDCANGLHPHPRRRAQRFRTGAGDRALAPHADAQQRPGCCENDRAGPAQVSDAASALHPPASGTAMPLRRLFLFALFATGGAFQLAGTVRAQADVLHVGTDATFAPMEFVDGGKRTGFDVELVEALAAAMGKKVEWIDIDFKGLIPGLLSNRFDMAVSAIYITDERKKVVDFTDPYFTGGLVTMVKVAAALKAPIDLNGKKVSVQVGTKSVSYLKQAFPQVQLVEVEKNQEMFNLVEIGRADALVTGKPAAYQYMRTRPGLQVVEPQLTTEEYGMALRKDTPELTRAVNAALAKLHSDGGYARIVAKWFPATK